MKQTTKHGQEGLQQRGKRTQDAHIIRKYGESTRQKGTFMLTHRSVKRTIARLNRWFARRKDSPHFSWRAAQVRSIIQSLEKAVNWIALFNSEGVLITLYPADKRRQRKFLRGECRPLYQSNNKEI